MRIRQQETGQEVGVSILPSLEGGGPEARGLLSAIAYDIAGRLISCLKGHCHEMDVYFKVSIFLSVFSV